MKTGETCGYDWGQSSIISLFALKRQNIVKIRAASHRQTMQMFVSIMYKICKEMYYAELNVFHCSKENNPEMESCHSQC
ncbi:hypothetical protein T4A_7780 [Trichinella pseudospiralis]|uniref:Uncharacterized protein n=1 Tax=Trichinella pseudospiralis TaxID=6337 RepID=A0A0V1E791_TRIPS|nr:hypothetical protein T4A_7780 [Trichinella pseudospiralis]